VNRSKDQAEGLRRMGGPTLHAAEPAGGRVIAVTGGKGGVGKSTVAVNLAALYARRGSRTLAFDGDLGMADLNLLLGLAPERSLADVLDGTPIEEILTVAHGIHLLPAQNGNYRLANLDDHDRRVLFGAVDSLADRFDTLIIDTPAGIGANAVALAGAVAEVVVVATPEPLSLADAYACLKVLATRQHLTRAYVLPNNVRSPSEADDIFARLSGLVERFLDIDLVPLPPIPHDPQVAQAAGAGMPLILYNPDSPAARALVHVARRIDALAARRLRSGELQGFLRRALGGSP